MPSFGNEFGEKLTHTLVATALCCTTATIAPEISVHAAVEAVLGAAGVGHLMWRLRATRADALLRRCAAQVAAGSDALLTTEYRDDPDAPVRRDAAVDAIREVLPLIVPQPAELVAARLTNDRVVAFYLDRAAKARPGAFAATAADGMARDLLRSVVANAWQLILRQPEFQADVLLDTLRELLSGLDELRHGQRAIRDDVSALPDAIVGRIVAQLDARGVARKAQEAGLERQAMIRIAGRLRPDENLDFDQAVVEVEHAVGIALEVIARGERGGKLDALVEAVLRRLAATTRAGDFDRGSRDVDDALRELARREAEQVDAMRRSRTALLEAGIEQDTLRRDAAAVARRIEALVAVAQPGERPAWTPAFRQRRDALYQEGRDKGINFSLEVAAALARRMLDTARDSDERGVAGNLLGIASRVLGERESGTARLEQAVEAYRAALLEYTRERVKLNWSATQNNLGNALWALGGRESGTARLEQAVAAYRAALEERTRERMPLDWATTQNNLGNALATLGERESGTARLEQAVAAYRAALLERTRERVPLDWAATQNGLGTALWRLGARESGTARLGQAVEVYRAALEERTRERVPLDWAMTQNNLGVALQALGERESGTARLEQAVVACRAALLERTRERVPLDWATTQNNLGNALQRLGERESGTARLEQAAEAYRAALQEYTRERVPLDWAMTQNNLGVALRALGERESGTARLQQAVEAYRAALEERTRERVPLDWAMTQNNLGLALQALGARESGTARLEQAVEAYRAALPERTRERVPLDWAGSQYNLANTLAILAARMNEPARAAEALDCMRGAAEVFRKAGDSYWLPITEQRASEIEAQLRQLQGQAPA